MKRINTLLIMLIQGENLLIETDLRTDVYLDLVFHVP